MHVCHECQLEESAHSLIGRPKIHLFGITELEFLPWSNLEFVSMRDITAAAKTAGCCCCGCSGGGSGGEMNTALWQHHHHQQQQ